MTAAATIRQGDLRRMAAIAKKEGVRIEMEIDGRVFRVSPDHPVKQEKVDRKEPVRL
jgi:hypothetical protein